ncbi:hypothetical protein CGCVW01_v014118, partial [Colletotrichum viniferum]
LGVDEVELHRHTVKDLEKKEPAEELQRPALAIVVDMTNPKGHIRVFDSAYNQVGVVQGEMNRGKMVIVIWKPEWQYVFFGEESCDIYHAYAKDMM